MAKTTVVLTRRMKDMPESYVIGHRQVNRNFIIWGKIFQRISDLKKINI